nr:Gag-Pol polyprotein [Tanacetum cinerariifolium]
MLEIRMGQLVFKEMEIRIRLGMVILWQPRRRDDAYLQIQLLIAQKEEAGIQLQAEEYDLMAAAADLDEIEEVTQNPRVQNDGIQNQNGNG